MFSEKSLSTCHGIQHSASDGDKCDEELFLPDLPNEISGEQLELQKKVFRANEVFMREHNDTLKWLNSPEDCRVYPKEAQKNTHAYKTKIKFLVTYMTGTKEPFTRE